MAWAGAAQASSWVRTRLAEIFRGNLRIGGHVRLLAEPAYYQLLKAEPIFKRSIPVLIVIFISYIAVFRIAGLHEEYELRRAHARDEATMLAATLATRLGAPDAGLETLVPETALTQVLSDAVPPSATSLGRKILITDPTGLIVATAPAQPRWRGRPITDLLGFAQPLTTFGARAGVMEITLTTGETAFATVAHIGGRLGSVAVIQTFDDVFAAWRTSLGNNVVMFSFTTLILLLLTYAYFAQIERSQAADDLHQDTTARAETAFRRGRCGLWDWDLSRGRIFWASSMFEMLEIDSKIGLIGYGDMAALVHPDDIDLDALVERLVAGRVLSIDKAFRMRRSDGEWLWFRIRADVVERAETGSRHLIGIASDITEQRQIAERNATADLRLRDAIDTISEAFVLWDAENRLVMCNGKYQRLHNLDDQAVAPGTPYQDVMRKARQPIVHTPIPQEGSSEDGARTYEAQIEDGRWLQINERRTKDGGFVSVGTDITQLKRHEERLTDSERQLKAMVMDLRQSRQALERQTQQLVEMAEKYADEKRRAEEANKIKSDFLANISHELRTPLNAILGFSDIMAHGVKGNFGPEKYAEYARDIHASGTFLLMVINDILDMSRIEAGAQTLHTEAVRLDEIVAEAARVLLPSAEEKQIALVTDDVAPDMAFTADRRAIKQVLINLLSNGVKFTEPGGRVTVRARRVGTAITLSINDNGIGIPREHIKHLGQPFVQVANQFTKTHKGSGLGLAIARSLVELHGGAMRIASTVGVGTIVSIRLPMVPAAQARETRPRERAALRR